MATDTPSFSDLTDRFRGYREARDPEVWRPLATKQEPKVLLIGCSDSRTDPATLFDAPPGSIFAVRNIAALVPPFKAGRKLDSVGSALWYGVTQLGVREIVVMGHESCGGVAACMSGALEDAAADGGGLVAGWLKPLRKARRKVRDGHGPDASHELELEAVRTSVANVRDYPFVAAAADGERGLKVTGAWFSIGSGELRLLGDDGAFRPA